ncbi:MAG: hypothetical protein WBC18_17735 [Ottowia sp.]|uniref:hypothetical protein n=1 Tax=Ottowia sp. TaxID=1898956 RepID=UPI003C7549B6
MNKLTLHHLTADSVDDEHGPSVMLTQQEGIEDPAVIVVHPWQLRAVCEQFGFIASDRKQRGPSPYCNAACLGC